MGYCSQKAFVLQLLAALDKVLIDQGHRHSPGAGVGGAIRNYEQAALQSPPPAKFSRGMLLPLRRWGPQPDVVVCRP